MIEGGLASMLPQVAEKTGQAAIPATSTTTLFNFTGNFEVLALFAVVRQNLQGNETLIKFTFNRDATSEDDLCASTDVTGDAAGTLLSITGTDSDVLAETAAGMLAPFTQANTIIITSDTGGTISLVNASEVNTGDLDYYIRWQPLSVGATVVAA